VAIDDIDIRHEESGGCGAYTVALSADERAELTYARLAPDHIVADHTYVPRAFRGQGIAEQMVERLVADARAGGTRITPVCWFVAGEFRRHGAEWEDLLKK
jgi:predicted GNAT family acetyltransferase